jgi:hypothetical protein
MEEEIEIRIQSLHNELDEIQNKFKTKLNDLKKIARKQLKCLMESKQTTKIAYEMTQSSEILNENTERINSEFEKIISKISFEPWIASIDPEVIGKIESGDLLLGEEVKSRLYSKFELNLYRNSPTSICSINDKYLLLTYNKDNKIVKLSSNYKVLDEIKIVDRMKLENPTLICTDGIGHVYLLNANNTQVIIMDLEMKTVKRVLRYSQFGSESIVSIMHCDGKLYVLDSNFLHVFTADGTFSNKMVLNISNPTNMTINENFIVIKDEKNKIFVFDLNGMLKTKIISDDIGNINSISLINGYLFIHSADGCFICYKQSNEDFELVFKRVIGDLRDVSASIIYFNRQIVVLLPYERSILLF